VSNNTKSWKARSAERSNRKKDRRQRSEEELRALLEERRSQKRSARRYDVRNGLKPFLLDGEYADLDAFTAWWNILSEQDQRNAWGIISGSSISLSMRVWHICRLVAER
jgi:hypothetical protein